MTRVCIAVRVRMYRDGLAERLRADPRVAAVYTAHDWGACLDAVGTTELDVVVLDLALPPRLDRVLDITAAAPGVQVIGLGVSTTADAIACAEAGFAGYVTCDDSLEELVDRIEAVRRGEMPCTPSVAACLLARLAELAGQAPLLPEPVPLTRREQQVAGLITEGLSNKEIGQALHIELATVKNHVHNILEKAGARRRTELGVRLHGTPSERPRI